MNYSNHEIAQMFDKTFEDGIEELDTSKVVVMKDIDLFSYCEHHMALMYDTNAFITHLSYLRYICNAASSLKLPLNSTVIVLVLFFLIPLVDTQL